MSKMFKLMENELDLTYASISYVRACIKNVETLADYILQYEDRKKYMSEMINLTEKISQYMSVIDLKMQTKQEYIEKIKKEIVEFQ